MKGLIIVMLLLAPLPAMAGELIPVNNSPFKDKQASIYYEWKFKSDPTLRYIADGYEDGIDYSLERLKPDGKLKLLLKITPVIADSRKQRWWGYPWDTSDIYLQVRKGVLYFYADFEHYVPRGLPSTTDKPVTMPALLLKGETTQPGQKEYALKLLSPLKFKWYSLPELIDKYKRVNADKSRDHILHTFREYEALNADLIYSVNHGKGKSGKPYATLRKESEAYGEGPYKTALIAARTRVCKSKDSEIADAFLRVLLATSNDASELPDTILGDMFVCQPALVSKSFMALPLSKQQALFSDLKFGFENTVYHRPKDDSRVLELRKKLQALKPSAM